MGNKTFSPEQFDKNYKLADLEDFKFGKPWFNKRVVLDEYTAEKVGTTGNLSQDATLFQTQVLQGVAYVPIRTGKRSKSSTEE